MSSLPEVLSPVSNIVSQGLALKHSTLHLPANNDRLRQSEPDQEPVDEHMRSVVPSPVDDEDEHAVEPSLRVGLVVHRASSGFALRANNLHSYLDLNRFVGALISHPGPESSSLMSCAA